jgi:hypothetical protein
LKGVRGLSDRPQAERLVAGRVKATEKINIPGETIEREETVIANARAIVELFLRRILKKEERKNVK